MERQGKLKVYTTNSCTFCHQAKRFLDKHNIKYTEIDAGTPEGSTELSALGSHGVPTFIIGDEMIVGFHEGKIAD